VILDEGDSQSASRDAFLLGDICIDPFGLEIRRSGSTQRVQAKVMEVLLALARQPGQVLSREELEQEVWRGRVVTDDALTNVIGKIRRALDDNPRQPRFIETIAKRGYRLNVSPTPIAGDVVAGIATRGTKVARQPLWRSWLLAGVLLAALTVLLAVWFWESSEPTTPSNSEGDRAISLAVIPFDVLGDDPSQAYFAEGISLDLITELSRVPGLLVIAPGTVFSYRDKEADDRRIASELGVRYLIRGGVQRIGERIRINVRVLDTNGGQTLWAERFVGEAERLFRIQDQVVQGIARGLPGRLELPERSADRRGATESIAAYDEFLRGLDYFGRRSPENNRLAKEHYERAIALNSGFARAYAGLAMVYARDATDGWDPKPDIALSRASELTEKAQRLDPSLHQVYFVEGLLALFRRNYEAAIGSTDHAISIKPSYADAYALRAWIEHFDGRIAEGLASMEQAVRLNPRIPSVYRVIRGALHYAQADLDKAIADLEIAVEVNPSFQNARIWLTAAYAAAGRIEDAQWQSSEILALHSDFSSLHSLWAFPIRDPAYSDRFLRDLRRAGLPD